ncbi:MAG: 3-oxoacyl-ACP reductase FabG [Candidatus Rokubacteria bacterium]|nr:3-oxoacyl-ACP reductase FabG [Candidatus Rokubacteria bacterium]MBI3108949.1 3-oxoacyl-ACP reductase FabG [Candidatus Rokubacteria bacterium]
MRLTERVAVVTGGAVGIGRAYSRRLAAEGARVVVADIVDPAPTVREIEAAGGEALGVSVDVTQEPMVRAMARTAVDHFGRIDILVNNAGIFAPLQPTPFEALSETEWDRIMAVNVKGVFFCCQAVVPTMKAQRSGRIINVASAIVMKGSPLFLHYVASKGAVIALTRALAREVGDYGIAVNAVAPGFVLSETVRQNPTLAGALSAPVVQSRCFRRDQTAEDVEGAVVYLASADSAFVTGQTLVVDGGSIFL